MQVTYFRRTLMLSAAAALIAAGGARTQAAVSEPQLPSTQPSTATPSPAQTSSATPSSATPQAQPSAQAQPSSPQPPSAKPPSTQTPAPSGQVIRRTFDIVATDVIVRDNTGQFIADLKKDDFEVYEDGVKQQLVSFLLTHGGRVYNESAPPPPPPMEGIILPPSKPTSDAAGRIFMIFVDDLHLNFRDTGRIKDLFKKVAKELIHEGDMFGIVSTGPSSLAIDLTYDRKRLDEAIDKISGAGLKPSEILDTQVGADGPPEVRYRAHVAFDTAYGIMKTLEQVHNRRKAFIYVSNGYDFNPFSETRKKQDQEKYNEMNPNAGNNNGDGSSDPSASSDTNPFMRTGNQFSFADLASEISELTREANRANTTIYTLDPRGLVGAPDLDEKVDMMDYQAYITTSQNSLRVLAEQTGGIAMVNQNDFVKTLKRIDAETSDYYVVGYYSSNPDPTQRRRRVEVKVKRPNTDLHYRTEYTLKPTKAPAPRK